jgi:hypothetical protein
MPVQELRVHGVSGTPPRNMLYTDPVELVPAEAATGIRRYVRSYRVATDDDYGVHGSVSAFHWGGLTSANRLTALWVLLLPFSFANLAGWAARHRTPTTITWVRLFGLLLTGMFINLAVIAGVDVYWHWSVGDDNRVGWAAAIFLGIGGLWWVLVSEASTRSHFDRLTFADRQRLLWSPHDTALDPPSVDSDEAPVWEDPAGWDISDERMWRPHSIVHRLRRLHFGFGYLMLAFAAAAAADTGWDVGLPADVPTIIALLLLVVSAWALVETGTTSQPGRLLRWLTVWHPIVGAVAAALGVLTFLLAGVEESRHWPHLHATSAMIVVIAAVVAVAAWFAGGGITAGAATLAVLFGLIFGAGVVLAVADYLGLAGYRVGGVNWVAAGVLVWMLAVVLIVGFTLVVNTRQRPARVMWYSIHATTGGLRKLFTAMPALAIITAGYILSRRCAPSGDLYEACIQEGSLPDRLPASATGLVTWLFVLAAMSLVVFFLRTGARVPAAVVIVGVAVILVLRPALTVMGVSFSFSDIEATALTFAVALPSLLIARRLTVGIMPGGAESRRGTGVIWDVVMFWPRWFHPLAPPAYGPHAVTSLRHEIETRAGLAPRTRRRPLIVACHSQGTIISLVAMALVGGVRRTNPTRFDLDRPERLAKLGMLTYGSPIAHLYDTYFPSAGFTHLAAAVAEGLDAYRGKGMSRWVNLHRATDPIGGPVLPEIDVEVPDPETPSDGQPVWHLHSRYEPSAPFRTERSRIDTLVNP